MFWHCTRRQSQTQHLTQRDILVVSLSHDQWCTKAPASGPTNWARITAKRGRVSLASLSASAEREGYVAKTPASGRPSITAAMSLRLAYREDRLQHVADTWQTIAALPHAVIIHTTKSAAFLVVVGEVRHADVASHSGVGSTYR